MASSGFELEGKLFKKFDTQQVSEKFKKREFVVETVNEQYPQKIKLEFTQEKCELLDKYSDGESVKVSFNLRGSEWQGKFFTNLQAWRIEKLAASNGTSSGNGSSENAPFPTEEPTFTSKGNDSIDDLPF